MYTVDELPPLAGDVLSLALAINAGGHVVGASVDANGARRPVHWAPGAPAALLPLPAAWPEGIATDIADANVIVGYYINSQTHFARSLAVRWVNGVATEIASPAGEWSEAFGVDSALRVVGTADFGHLQPGAFEAAAFTPPAFLFDRVYSEALAANATLDVIVGAIVSGQSLVGFSFHAGNLTLLPTVNGNRASAQAVNASGDAVGWSTVDAAGTLPHAVRWRNAIPHDLMPGAASPSLASGISDDGVIVGYAMDGGPPYACAWTNDVPQNLNGVVVGTTGWDLRVATAINNTGQIVGVGLLNGTKRAFRLTPVPTPNVFFAKSGPTTVERMQDFDYQITVLNQSGTPIPNFRISDRLPQDVTYVSSTDGGVYQPTSHSVLWQLGAFAPNVARTLTLTVTAIGSAGDTLVNRCYWRSAQTLPVWANDVLTLIEHPPLTIEVISPQPCEALAAGAVAMLRADVSDPSVVTEVEYFTGASTSLGVSTTAPYEVPWGPVSTGIHCVRSVARGVTDAWSEPLCVLVGLGALPADAYHVTQLGLDPHNEPWAITQSGMSVGRAGGYAGQDRPVWWPAPNVALQTSLPTQVITTAFGGSYGVNEVNDIVGDVVSDGITKAFVYAGGTLAVLSNSNLLTRAHDVNDAGTVVGIFVRGGSFHAFSWSAGLLTELSELGGGASEAYAINAAGVIAGSMAVGGSEMRATLWTNGVPLVIDTLGGDKGQALAITDENLVTGSAVTAAGEAHAFLWSPSTGMVDIHTIGDSSGGRGVNAYGQVVGEYSLGGARRGFVYTCGQMYDLTSLIAPASGWTIETAAAINDDGMIVCLATQGGPSSGLLLIPRA